MTIAIPRLQDLSYFETALLTVARGGNFETVRRDLVDRARDLDRDSDLDGSFDPRRWDARRRDHKKYVNNAVEVLKEMMAFGWITATPLPSSPNSAHLHTETTFELLEPGAAWAEVVTKDRRAAYAQLTERLIAAHPQFPGFLRAVGAMEDSTSDSLTVPLLRWQPERHRSEDEFLNDLVKVVRIAVRSGQVGWSAEEDVVASAVHDYVQRIRVRRQARDKTQTRKEFVKTCEEAVVKLAFSAAGAPIDYISMELLRRWTRFLGVANFSYHGPGSYGLRLWATGQVRRDEAGLSITRRVGPDIRRQLLATLPEVWEQKKPAGMYLPVWELRAASCWRHRVADGEWDKAVIELLRGDHPQLPYRLHLDQASLGPAPASTQPLVVPTAGGHRRIFNSVTLIPAKEKP